jgi:hypothetical protein
MSLTLEENECTALKRALDYYLPQLRMERARSDTRDAQHSLSELETTLEEIRARLT